jgi:hypothetical protein
VSFLFVKCLAFIFSQFWCLSSYHVSFLMCLLCPDNSTTFHPLREETLARIEDYIILVVAAISRGDWPLQLPIHGSDEMMTWKLAKQRRKCLLLFHLLAKSHALLRTNTTSTKRYSTCSTLHCWLMNASLHRIYIASWLHISGLDLSLFFFLLIQ